MGHERLGMLPKSEKWNELRETIAGFNEVSADVSDIIEKMATNVEERYSNLNKSESVKKAVQILIKIGKSAGEKSGEQDQHPFVSQDIESILDLTEKIKKDLDDTDDSPEYRQLTETALINTVKKWYLNTKEASPFDLFENNPDLNRYFSNINSGKGFCKISRNFFSELTSEYLKYYLDRSASNHIDSIDLRDKFQENIEEHSDMISSYALEATEITQSYAAGWYNKRAKESIPSREEITGFLNLTSKKLQQELERERS